MTIGSVRRAFTSPTAPAYAFDAYGNAIGSATRVTDFGFAGMFYHADSGLYLTQYRAYNPNTGRWLSRDPLGESSDPAGNLYPYVEGNPVSYFDPFGLQLNFEQQSRIWAAAEDWANSSVPYEVGGSEKSGADCSGSVSSIYAQAGINIGRLYSGQFANSPSFSRVTGQPQVGDVGVTPGHVVLYGGDLGADALYGVRSARVDQTLGGRIAGILASKLGTAIRRQAQNVPVATDMKRGV